MTNESYWIWMQLLFGIGTRRCELIMDYFPHPREIYEGIRSGNHVGGMLTEEEAASWELAMERATELLRRTRKKGCQVITPEHPDYPTLLRPLFDRPAALYCKGDLGCLKDGLSIAVVGTRKHTRYGREAASLLAGGLARGGAVVVSGLATGVDSESHRSALAAGGKTIGVLGCGIDVDYPRASRELKTAMSTNGAVVTEFPLGYPAMPENFPLRNRIISGMCRGTLVVEADVASGSLITARLAAEQGRDIFAVPGSIFEQNARGVHRILKEGARLVESVEDILGLYPEYGRLRGREKPESPLQHWDTGREAETPPPVPLKKKPKIQPPPQPRPLPTGVSEQAVQVYEAFGTDTMTVEELITAAGGIGVSQLQSALTELELYALIQSYPGRRFGLL